MELRHLRYFVAVAEELNFRKAAERLHVSQPALSSQIQDLESELDLRLLDRNTGGVRLTEAGTAFLEATRQTLAQAQRAVTLAREADQGRRGRLTVGFYAPLLMGFMPASLAAFHRQYPGVDVNLVEMSLGEQAAALASQTIQLGFAIAGYRPFPHGLQHAEVVRSPIRAVVGRSHRLARRPRVALADLKDEQFLSLAPVKGSTIHCDRIRSAFKARGLKIRPIRSIVGAEAFRANLESGFGVSLIAEVGSLSRSPDLRFKPLTDTGEDLFMELHALWTAGPASALITNFIAVMQAVAPKEKPRMDAIRLRQGTAREINAHDGGPIF
jgi:DNA-binding transcriptional LysR family regulator